MTKIAVITDTHANLPALEAALATIGELRCESIYHTGDAVGAGPFPSEVLDRLLHTPNIHLVMGNHDELCAFGVPEPRPDWMDDLLAANAEWTRARVSPEIRGAMVSWPYEIVEMIAGRQYAFLHDPRGPVGSGFAPIIENPGAGDLDVLFSAVQADLIFYGHHHPAADHTGRARYINPGSLGCETGATARFTVMDLERDGVPAIRHHAVPYDRVPLHEELVRRDVPAHEFVRQAFFP